MQLYCTITAHSGNRVPLTLNDEEIAATGITPTQLRQKISTCTRIPLKDLRLIFRGRMIKDDDSIASVITEYKLENDSVLHCMGKPVEMNNISSNSNGSSSSSSDTAMAVVPDTTTVNNRTVVPPLSTSTTATANHDATAAAVAGSAASTIGAAVAVAAAASGDPLTAALTRLRQNNPPSVYATAVATLEKVLKNIVDNPLQEKYRQVKRQNATFRKRLGGLVGGHDCMLATGFIVANENENGSGSGEEVYKLEASAERWNTLTQAQKVIIAASQQAKLQQQQARQQPTMGAGGGGAFGTTAMPNGGAAMGAGAGMGGFPPAGMNDPNMQNMMSQVMSNPEALGAALQNPMVQQMMQNDPNVSPMLRQYMESMSSNPAMLQQMTQRMQDPAVQAQMRQAMAANGGSMPGMPGMNMPGMGMPGGAANSTGAGSASNNNNSAAAPPPPPQNDQGQTEDDMIAEAIRRSLEGNN